MVLAQRELRLPCVVARPQWDVRFGCDEEWWVIVIACLDWENRGVAGVVQGRWLW